MDQQMATLVAAGIAAAVGIVTAALSALSVRGSSKTSRAIAESENEVKLEIQRRMESHDVAGSERDYRIRQLNELYGPIHMLRRRSRRLWEQLRPDTLSPGDEWHVHDHVAEIRSDRVRSRILDDILQINARLEELIIGRAGLLWRQPAPDSFYEFLEHAALVSIAVEQGGVPEGRKRVYFPEQFDGDVDEAFEALTRAIIGLNEPEVSR